MRLGIASFRGEVPAMTPRGLPENAAQAAINARLQSGDLEAWRQFLLTAALANTGTVQTIYKLSSAWLSWNAQVDVARGLIPGDTTFRIFLTSPALYGRPQFTNFTLATTGAAPYPVTTRALGVGAPSAAPTVAVGVDPTPTSFSVDVTDAGDVLATAWDVTPTVTGATYNSSVNQRTDLGNPGACYQLNWRDFGDQSGGPRIKRDFGVGNANVVSMDFDFFQNEISGSARLIAGLKRSAAGAGISAMITDASGTFTLHLGTAPSWEQGRSQSTVVTSAPFSTITIGAWWRGRLSAVTNLDNTTTATFSVIDPADDSVLASITTNLSLDIDAIGGWCGFTSGEDQLGGDSFARIDNVHVTASGSTGYSPVNLATSYLFTYENDLGQQSAPSPVTATLLRPDGIAVTLTTPTTLPVGYSDYGITTKVFFRAVTGTGGTVFKLVGRIPYTQADLVDSLPDEQTGPEILQSEDWDLPPVGLQGIIALPNDCMAGFFANQLCFSAQGFPHAWPVKFRKTTDTDIVAIKNIDTTVVVGTKSFVYTATGNSPDAYSMSQPGEAQSCVSKLGMVFLDGQGVAFPSPDGYQLCRGSAGSLINLTDNTFTKEQWEALVPASLIAAVHDGVLHFFYSTGSAKGGYAMDTKQHGFGLVQLAYHATAAHAEPITDGLYLVLDQVSEPTHVLLPLASTAVTPNGLTIYQFNASTVSHMVYRWKGKLNLMPWPTTLHFSRVRALSYTNLVFRTYADGVLIDTQLVTDSNLVRLPGLDCHDSYEFEFIGTNTVRTQGAFESPSEIV